MVLATFHVGLDWADDAMRVTAASFGLELIDPRVTLAAYLILGEQPAVKHVDLVSNRPRPYYVVALDMARRSNNPVSYLEHYLTGNYTAQTVLSGGPDRPLQRLTLDLRLTVTG